MRGLEGVGGIGKSVIGIAIQRLGPCQDEPCRAVMRGPRDEKAQRSAGMWIGLGVGQGLFLGLHVLEIR